MPRKRIKERGLVTPDSAAKDAGEPVIERREELKATAHDNAKAKRPGGK